MSGVTRTLHLGRRYFDFPLSISEPGAGQSLEQRLVVPETTLLDGRGLRTAPHPARLGSARSGVLFVCSGAAARSWKSSPEVAYHDDWSTRYLLGEIRKIGRAHV